MHIYRPSKGFTLIELLIVIGVIGLLLAVVFGAIKGSRDKAADAQVKKVLSEVALKAEQQEIAPGVVRYDSAFESTQAIKEIEALAATVGVEADAYQYDVSKTGYAIVFPLRRGGYYCIDSAGKATGREVTGLFADDGPKNCDNATYSRTGSGENVGPTLVLLGDNPLRQFTNSSLQYTEPGYTATDPEDGDITGSVTVDDPNCPAGQLCSPTTTSYTTATGSCDLEFFTLRYTVTDSAGMSDSKTRSVTVTECSPSMF